MPKNKGGNQKNRKEKSSIKYTQNFFRKPQIIRDLIKRSNIKYNDLVYEIGPGKGIITKELSKTGADIIAIEKDKELGIKLKEKFSDYSNVKIKIGDFLKENLPKNREYKVFSNIPFIITADIIKKLTLSKNPPIDIYLGVQKEAAKKFSGSPREKLASLLLKPFFEIFILYHFKRKDFYPVPNVDIVLLRIKKREKELVGKNNINLYKDFIVYGFNQRKSSIVKTFKKIFTNKQINKLSKNLNFKPSAKPSHLSFQQWLGLFNYFLENVEEKKRLVYGWFATLKHQQSKLQKVHRNRKK